MFCYNLLFVSFCANWFVNDPFLDVFLSRYRYSHLFFLVHYGGAFLSLVPMTVFLWTPVQHCARHHYELNIEWDCVSVNGLQTFSLPFSPNDLPSRGIHNFHLEVMIVSFLRMQSLSIWDCSVTSYLLHYATNSQCLVSWTCWRWTHQIFETLERTTTTDVLEQIKASVSLLPPATQVSQQTLLVQCWFCICPSSLYLRTHQNPTLFEFSNVSEREDLLGSYPEGAHYIETWSKSPSPRFCWCTDLLMVAKVVRKRNE